MKRFIAIVDSLIKTVESWFFSTPDDVAWLTLEDRMYSEIRLDSGNSKNRRTQVRQWCIKQGLEKPWSLSSLKSRKWKERVI